MSKYRANTDNNSKLISFRLDRDTADYYSKRAKERGTTLSDYLRQIMTQGMIAESVLDVEQRMRAIVTEFGQTAGNGGTGGFPENVLMSIYTSEFLLTAIIEARNIQELYDAQDKAKVRIQKERGNS